MVPETIEETAALACLVAAGCSISAEPQGGGDTRTKQERVRTPDSPDGMNRGGGGGGM